MVKYITNELILIDINIKKTSLYIVKITNKYIFNYLSVGMTLMKMTKNVDCI